MLRAFDRLIDIMALVAGALLCLLVVTVCANVLSRYFHLFAMPWALDVVEHSLYLITFLGAPWVLREQGHIAIDVFLQQLSPRPRAVVDRIAYAIGAVVCAILLYIACQVWLQSFLAGTTIHRTYVYPEWWLLSVAPPNFLILLVIFLRWLIFGPPASAAMPETPADGL